MRHLFRQKLNEIWVGEEVHQLLRMATPCHTNSRIRQDPARPCWANLMA
jgi:hypothetical protein